MDPAAKHGGASHRHTTTNSIASLVSDGEVLIAGAKFSDALELFKQALDLTEGSGLRGTPLYLSVLTTLGELSYAVGRYTDAERYTLDYLAVSPESADSAYVRLTLAKVYLAARKLRQSLAVTGQAILFAESAEGQDYNPSLLAEAHWLRALIYRGLNMPKDAANSCMDALTTFSDVYGSDHPRTLLCEASYHLFSIRLGDISEAATRLPHILASLRKRKPEDDSDLITPLSANAHLACYQAKELRSLRKLIRNRSNPTTKSAVQSVLHSFGLDNDAHDWLAQCGRQISSDDFRGFLESLEERLLKRAASYLKEELVLAQRCHGNDHPCLTEVLEQLSAVSGWLGLKEEQIRYKKEATRIRELNRPNAEL